jgi:hypothetical protein
MKTIDLSQASKSLSAYADDLDPRRGTPCRDGRSREA